MGHGGKPPPVFLKAAAPLRRRFHGGNQGALQFQQLPRDGRQAVNILIQDAQILSLQRPGVLAGEQPSNGVGHLRGLVLELVAAQHPDALHGKPRDGGRDGDVHGGQGTPDFPAQQLQPFPPPGQPEPAFPAVLPEIPMAALPPGQAQIRAFRRNFKGNPLLLAHLFRENGKSGGHAQPHLPAGLLHAFLCLFIQTEVNHNLSHGLRPLS